MTRSPEDEFIEALDGHMFRTQEDLEFVLLQYILEFNEARSASPGAVVYKGYNESDDGVVLETFPFSATRTTPAGASSFFRIAWEDLETLAKRLNVWITS